MLGLDLLQVHSYPDLRHPLRDVDIFGTPAAALAGARPLLLGEFPGNGPERHPPRATPPPTTLDDYLEFARGAGLRGRVAVELQRHGRLRAAAAGAVGTLRARASRARELEVRAMTGRPSLPTLGWQMVKDANRTLGGGHAGYRADAPLVLAARLARRHGTRAAGRGIALHARDEPAGLLRRFGVARRRHRGSGRGPCLAHRPWLAGRDVAERRHFTARRIARRSRGAGGGHACGRGADSLERVGPGASVRPGHPACVGHG